MTEQEFRDETKDGYTYLQAFWMSVATRNKCLYCKTKFPEGLVNKHPGVSTFPIDSKFWFTPAFLHHLKDTHGYCPETMTSFLTNLSEYTERIPVPKDL